MEKVICSCGKVFVGPRAEARCSTHRGNSVIHKKPLVGEAKLSSRIAKYTHYFYRGYIIYDDGGKSQQSRPWCVIRPDMKHSYHMESESDAQRYIDNHIEPRSLRVINMLEIKRLRAEKKKLSDKIRFLLAGGKLEDWKE